MAEHRNSRRADTRGPGRRRPWRRSRRLRRAARRIIPVVLGMVLLAGIVLFVRHENASITKPSASPTATTLPAPQPTKPGVDYFYAKDQPYVTPKIEVKAPPTEYTMFFIENIGRHGSRSDTSDGPEQDVLKLLKKAKDKSALTKLGKGLSADLTRFSADQKKVGYGQESTLGKAEWKGIGERTAANYSRFFSALQKDGNAVSLVTTPVNRTKVSMAAFRGGLSKQYSSLDVQPPVTEPSYVSFGSTVSQEANDALDTINNSPKVEAAAANFLRGIFVPEYVGSMHGKVDKALEFYGLYATAAGMRLDSQVNFHQYLSRKDAAALAYARDAGTFYTYGPGVAGQHQTFERARVLRTAFFDALDERIKGGKTAAVFRIAHGETTIPFAALLQLPGSEKQADPNVPYTYANNPWRGAQVGGMADNIEWVAYRDSKQNVLVTMRYNEKPALFRSQCRPVASGSFFYTLQELKTCLPSS